MGPEKFIETTPEQDMAELALAHAKDWQKILSDPSKQNELIEESVIIQQLDSLYPYTGEVVYMSGLGMHPVQDEEGGEVLGEVWEHRLDQGGIHNGFYIDDYSDEGVSGRQIMHQVFVSKTREKIGKTTFRDQVTFSLYNLDSLVLPASNMEQLLGVDIEGGIENFEDQIHLMMSYSSELTKLYKSTTFRRLNHSQQISVVGALVSEADKQTKLRDQTIIIEAKYAYMPLLSRDWHLMIFGIDEVSISGTCIGLESTESVSMKQRAIRRDADLVDKKAGLCLVIDPDEFTREALKLPQDSILYLPTASQPFQIIGAA